MFTRIAGAILTVLGIWASALCDRPAASATELLRRYHELYDRQDWAKIYHQAAPELHERISLSDWQASFQELYNRLGSITASSQSGYTISFRSAVALHVEIRMLNECQKGKKQEERAVFL